MKKSVLIIFIIMLSSIVFGNVSIAQEQYDVGEYYQLGKYNNQPIVWRCIDTKDENGILMVSDKILCFKAANAGSGNRNESTTTCYGEGLWENTTLRIWLNSTEPFGEVKWKTYPPDTEHIASQAKIKYPYADEAGFLSNENFTKSEISAMKTVSQWNALTVNRIDEATNGVKTPFIFNYSISIGRNGYETVGRLDYEDLRDGYRGAMYRLEDTVFVLDEVQAYKTYKVLDTLDTVSVKESDDRPYYWLRSPAQQAYEEETAAMTAITNFHSGLSVSRELGVRPAFYLNEDVAFIKSGSGTESDPYVLDGVEQDAITVFTNDGQLEFDVEPITENDRTLVGMRTVFESLGAEVEWEQSTNTVIAMKEDTIIQLQIDNNVMLRNGEEIQLDTPARIVNDRTMVPLRAVSEALNARVDWVEGLHRVVIDKPEEWVETEWNPEWYQEALRAGGYLK